MVPVRYTNMAADVSRRAGNRCRAGIAGEEDEVVRAAAEHAASVHGHIDNPELRGMIRASLRTNQPSLKHAETDRPEIVDSANRPRASCVGEETTRAASCQGPPDKPRPALCHDDNCCAGAQEGCSGPGE